MRQLGKGAAAWDCEYETVEECLPSVTYGNRGSCVPNPYAAPAAVSAPAPVAAPSTAPTSTTRDAEPQSPGERKIMRTASKLVVAAAVAASSVHSRFGIAKCLCTRNLTSVGSILFCLGKVRIQKRVNLTLEVSSLVIVYVD